jgi:ectoine hydroxylase
LAPTGRKPCLIGKVPQGGKLETIPCAAAEAVATVVRLDAMSLQEKDLAGPAFKQELSTVASGAVHATGRALPMYLTDDSVVAFNRDGFLKVERLFDEREVAAMLAAVEEGGRVASSTWASKDADGRASRLALWFELGDDIWASASTCPRVVNNIRILLGEEIAFFHGKVMLKEAHTGGAWEWHQDYGYWYLQGYAFPRLLSVFVALDPATRENGCLQVLRGSHRLGRLDHGRVGSQTGADPARIQEIEKLFERVHCVMEPGDALFFHCNLLHSSAPNDSDDDRRSFIMCYNALANPQFAEKKTSEQRPCPVGPDDAILRFASPERSLLGAVGGGS